MTSVASALLKRAWVLMQPENCFEAALPPYFLYIMELGVWPFNFLNWLNFAFPTIRKSTDFQGTVLEGLIHGTRLQHGDLHGFYMCPRWWEAARPGTSIWTLLGLSTCLSFQAQALSIGPCELKNHMISISKVLMISTSPALSSELFENFTYFSHSPPFWDSF